MQGIENVKKERIINFTEYKIFKLRFIAVDVCIAIKFLLPNLHLIPQ